MLQRALISKILLFCVAGFFICGCASVKPTKPESLTTQELIETLRHERIEQLYYDKFPANVKELMVRPNIVLDLSDAYTRGGDDLYRFNVVVILNHRAALSDSEKTAIAQCLDRALNDHAPWVRTEAVWGLGILAAARSIPSVILLLDDPDQNVVNESGRAQTPSATFFRENVAWKELTNS
jgi:hypothetical protein